MLKTTTDFTQDPNFILARRLNSQLLKHPLDPSVAVGLQHEIGKRILPEAHGRMVVPTAYGFPMIIELETSHTPSMQGSIERNLYFLGTYEPGTLEVIRRSLETWGEGATFADIGAHNGLMSIYAASVGAQQVFSFEPNPGMFELMQANVALNGCLNIKTFALALGEKRQTVSMETDYQNSGAAHIVEAQTASVRDVAMDTLDHLARQHDIGRINLLLMDVEGYEINVLNGAEKMIAAGKPDLIIEYDPSDQDRRVVAFLRKHGYQLYVLEHSRHIVGELVPFRKSTGATQMDNLFCFQPDRAEKLGLA